MAELDLVRKAPLVAVGTHPENKRILAGYYKVHVDPSQLKQCTRTVMACLAAPGVEIEAIVNSAKAIGGIVEQGQIGGPVSAEFDAMIEGGAAVRELSNGGVMAWRDRGVLTTESRKVDGIMVVPMPTQMVETENPTPIPNISPTNSVDSLEKNPFLKSVS